MKRLIALLLCLATLVCVFAGCSNNENGEEEVGSYIKMYLTDPVYNFDPAYAYQNESVLKVVSLLYDNLFVLNEKGEVKKSLVKKYEIDKEENTMLITLREDSCWSDSRLISADDVVYAWERILDPANSYEAATLLYDIKGAKALKEGEINSIDDVGVEAFSKNEILITFEEGVDYDNFIRNLTSYALSPIRRDIAGLTTKANDWAKSTTIIATSGPFKIRTLSYKDEDARIILERNAYYRRDYMEDDIDKSVTPYRLIIDYTMSDEEILAAYENGEIFYVGDIPYSVRSTYSADEWAEKAEISDALSTHSYVFNENAVVRYYNSSTFADLSKNECVYDSTLVDGTDGDKIFANADVRNALSLAINREAIANQVVFAEVATGLIPTGVYETDSIKNMFRSNGTTTIASTADLAAAKALLAKANIDPSKYMFAISVAAYDDVHVEIAKAVQAAWGTNGLGFNVALNLIDNIDNTDTAISTNAPVTGVKDDIFLESYTEGKYEVAAIDFTAYSSNAFASLALFAKGYTGEKSNVPYTNQYIIPTHKTGYNNPDYDAKIDEAYAEKDLSKRAALLHKAEEILMTDMPIIPIVFNKNAVMISKNLKNVEFSGYNNPIFTEAKLKEEKISAPAKDSAEAVSALKSNGYNAVVDSSQGAALEESAKISGVTELVTGTATIEGVEEQVYIMYFSDKDVAKTELKDVIRYSDKKATKTASECGDWICVLSGNMIYFGTKNAVKAAK